MTDAEKNLVDMLWDEWKYRNALYWSTFYRFGFIVLFVSFIPYVYPQVISHLGRLVVVFPVAGGLISLFAAWLLDAEAARFSYVTKTLDIHRGDFKAKRFPTDGSIVWKLRKIRGIVNSCG